MQMGHVQRLSASASASSAHAAIPNAYGGIAYDDGQYLATDTSAGQYAGFCQPYGYDSAPRSLPQVFPPPAVRSSINSDSDDVALSFGYHN